MRDGRFFALGDRRGGRGGAHRSRHAAQYARPLGTTLRNLTIVVQLEPLARDGRDWGRPNWRIV